MAETISGLVDHIIYRNEDNGYTVLVLKDKGHETTLVGFFQSLSVGETLEAEGRFTSHASYGEQFKVEKYTVTVPETEAAIEKYLGSGAIKGIGAALAARIVSLFGDDTLRIIEEEPERLAEVKGISMKKARDIAEQADSQRSMRRAMLFLQQYGVSLNLAVKIYRTYDEQMYDILRDNPYRLAEDVSGVGFKTADEIAARLGISADSSDRIRAGILYCLSNAAGEGSVFLPERELCLRAADLLSVEPDAVEHEMGELSLARKIIRKTALLPLPAAAQNAYGMPAGVPDADGFFAGAPDQGGMAADSFREAAEGGAAVGETPVVYAASYYYLELNTARMLSDLNVVTETDEAGVRRRFDTLTRSGSVELAPEQREAVCLAAMNGVSILTGGPGTGKTTAINEMIRFFESEGCHIALAAPTGRAAKRMTETTGREASTIHRLLEINASSEELEERESLHFERNESNPLEADVVIIDEMSMVDIFLMHALLSAITRGSHLVLVGDVDQLPSVGPGAVLSDMIRSGVFPCTTLTHIFRQAAESDIIVNAHHINRGEGIALGNKSRDFFFLRRSDTNLIISNMIELIRDKLPRYVNATPYDIQVLTPMRKGALGVERLNRILQQYLNPAEAGKAEKAFGDDLFRVGDKVMQVKNNYQMPWEIRGKYGIPTEEGEGIFNGDLGVIREINEFASSMTIEFDEGRFVEYPFASLEELELAYAVTIHKSQGSEYPAVLLPLLTGPRMLFTRNLLYTAVTRARKCVIILGSEQTVTDMIGNARGKGRYTSLDERIREIWELDHRDNF